MILLRFILFLVLAYYLMKLLMRWIVGSSRGGTRYTDGGGPSRGAERPYSALTDQEIEDADFEEIERDDG